MKNLLRNNRRYITFYIFIILNCNSTKAQIADWIGDQVKGYIYNQVNSVLNSTNSMLGTFGSTIWEGVVEAKTEGDLKEEMAKFKEFPVETGQLSSAQSRYGIRNSNIDYRSIYWIQSDLTKSIVNDMRNLPSGELCNSSVSECMEQSCDSLADTMVFKELKSCLNKEAMDSLNVLLQTSHEWGDILLSDIKKNKSLAIVINNHPSILRVYYNTIEDTFLRNNPKHLLYWAVYADSHKNRLTENVPIINPRNVKFRKSGNYTILILDDTEIGWMKDNVIECQDVRLLNMIGQEEFSYHFDNQIFRTDNIGRVIQVHQNICKANKGKFKQKYKTRAKDFYDIKGCDGNNMEYMPASPKYKAPMVFANIFFIEMNQENKLALKALKRLEKEAGKKFKDYIVTTNIQYGNTDNVPASITVDYPVGSITLTNPNCRKLLDASTSAFISSQKEESKKIMQIKSYYEDAITVGNFTDNVKNEEVEY